MSFQFGSSNFGNTAVLEDLNGENRHAMRKTKRDDAALNRANVPNASKRAALGTITNQTRVQPFRAAKGQAPRNTIDPFASGNDENAFAGKSNKTGGFCIPTSQPFSIHIDNEPAKSAQIIKPAEHQLELRPDVTKLGLPRVPLSSAFPCAASKPSETAESPMVLDLSSDESMSERTADETRKDIITCVPEYTDDIYEYLREAETRHRPRANYMKKQPDITNSMRSILIDWLVEVAEEYKLHRETLCLSINYIDRFLSSMSVLRGKLQLVGAASMFLAAKYEEIYPPEVGEFVYITDDTYTKKQVLRMEHLILKVLSFDVAVPTINCFCDWYLKRIGADEEMSSLAMYLAELTLVDTETYLKYNPSVISAAATCLANLTVNSEFWTSELEHATKYQYHEVEPCLQDLLKTYKASASNPQQAIREKYKSSKFHNVSSLTPPTQLPVMMQ
ncbi:G2/mitotic-specific cyclin-A-like [Lineus longissimus]|uniref:G2/mitotic-specific cyclin-A-like n=1 Tax=Lineus longissimus TaxID=88925 RepID=UPI002B4D6D98